MFRQCLVAILLLALSPISAFADTTVLSSTMNRVRMVELFTSEGCSSCPPADRWLSTLTSDRRLWNEIVPIAFHVDYWDYLGWKDRFADEAFTTRQRQYRRFGHTRQVYTPGFVVAGQEWRGWFRNPNLGDAETATVGILRVEVEGDRFQAHFRPNGIRLRSPKLNLAILGFGLSTPVEAGENHGRTLTHDFVVLNYAQAAMLSGETRLGAEGELPKPRAPAPRYALAAWVSDGRDPQPIQALGGWLER